MALAGLEEKHFEQIREAFRWTDAVTPHIRGSVQVFAVDKPKTALAEPLPVICAVGINYTQNGRTSTELFQYEEDGIGVVRSTTSTAAVLSVVNAYERNRVAWTSLPAVDPPSPMKYYGADDATARIGAVSKGGFILIMTNLCPLITTSEWAKQPPAISESLLQACAEFSHLDDLHDALGESIDLWIGHSALGGTRWVWPAFAAFVRRRGIDQWLLTQNLSPRSHRWFEDYFRRPKHRLFPWYGPAIKKASPA
jgi:hypothetical protein